MSLRSYTEHYVDFCLREVAAAASALATWRLKALFALPARSGDEHSKAAAGLHGPGVEEAELAAFRC